MEGERLTDQGKNGPSDDMLQAQRGDGKVTDDHGWLGHPERMPAIQHDQNPPRSQGNVAIRVRILFGIRIGVNCPRMDTHRIPKPDSPSEDFELGWALPALGRRETDAVHRDHRHDQGLEAHQIGDGRARLPLGLPFVQKAPCGNSIAVHLTAGIGRDVFHHGEESVVEGILET